MQNWEGGVVKGGGTVHSWCGLQVGLSGIDSRNEKSSASCCVV